MASRTPTKQQTLRQKSNELAAASSQVVAHRVTRMVLAGPMPSERDRTEFTRMVEEKHQAFSESWLAMAAQSLVAQQAITTTAWRSMFYPWLGGGATPRAMAEQMQQAGMGVIQKGMAPVHRKAMANAKRLAKTPLV
ncbi:MAG: polyhydroxyalkanoate granule-associated phasin [Hydrogenophaga sp.]